MTKAKASPSREMKPKWRLNAFTHEIVSPAGVVVARLRIGRLNGTAINILADNEIVRSGGPSLHNVISMAVYQKDSIPAERLETEFHYLTGQSFPGHTVRARATTEPEPETHVLFRVFKREVTAVFPCDPATLTGDTMTCYAHIGQHGSCSFGWYSERTRAATPAEYADLKRELESAPYGYRLKVYKRMTRGHRAAFNAELRRLRGRA
jgi:hypothetical protein